MSNYSVVKIYDDAHVKEIAQDTSGSELSANMKNNKELSKFISKQEVGFISVNTEETMRSLIQVSDLLRLAFAGSKGEPCSTPILGMQSDYQDLVKGSLVTSGKFFRTSLQAVNYHYSATKMFMKAKDIKILKEEDSKLKSLLIQNSLKILGKCASVSKEMSLICDKLIENCNSLINQAKKSLLAANNDSNRNKAEKKELEQKIAEMEALQNELETKKKEYNEAVEKYDKDEERLDSKATTAMWVNMVSTVAGGLCKAAGSIAAARTFSVSLSNPEASKSTTEQPNVTNDKNKKSSKEISDENLKLAEEKAANKVKLEKAEKELSETEKKLTLENEKLEKLKESSADKAEIEISQNNIKNLEETKSNSEKDIAACNAKAEKYEQAGKHLSEAFEKLSESTEKASKSFSERADEAGKKAYEFRKLKAEVTGQLAKTVKVLASSKTNKNTVEKTIAALDVVVAVLGKIKTAFSNTKVFWEGVQAFCEELTKTNEDVEIYSNISLFDESFLEIMEVVKSSTLKWITLANINYRAYESMKVAAGEVDNAMINIPDEREAMNIIDTLAPEILKQIEKESNI